jgi:hypothetical protein
MIFLVQMQRQVNKAAGEGAFFEKWAPLEKRQNSFCRGKHLDLYLY